MVDATASIRAMQPAHAPLMSAARASSSEASWLVSYGDGEAFAAYRRLCDGAAVSPSQSPAWIAAWLENARPDALFAVASLHGRPVMGIALEVVKQGLFKVARFMGGRHACGNFPPVSGEFDSASAANLMQSLLKALKDVRSDIDALSLERLATHIAGIRNPLLDLPHTQSPNLALAVDLDGGFEALLARVSGKRKKKKHRSQTRKFEAIGPFKRFQAASAEEVRRVLGDFFAMKESRFRQKGIDDVFAPAEVRGFFETLFSNALRDEKPAFVLHALEVGGKLRAVTGSSVEGKRLICEFGAIADDELSSASPGDYLFFDNIREACADGCLVYDFSVGDEPYKRLWCDLEIKQFDAYVALSPRGHLLATFLRVQNRLKSAVKNSPLAWKLAKALRRQKAVAKDEE